MTTASTLSFETARTGLRQWIATLAGIALAAVQWADEPRVAVDGACVLLNVIAERSIGQDERQQEYDAAQVNGAEIIRKVGGPRVITISVHYDGYDQRLHLSPVTAASALKARMGGDDSAYALRELGFAFVDATGPVNAPRSDNGRVYPRAVIDVRLGYTRVESDTATQWIETVIAKSRVRDVDGVELPIPPNSTVEIEV